MLTLAVQFARNDHGWRTLRVMSNIIQFQSENMQRMLKLQGCWMSYGMQLCLRCSMNLSRTLMPTWYYYKTVSNCFRKILLTKLVAPRGLQPCIEISSSFNTLSWVFQRGISQHRWICLVAFANKEWNAKGWIVFSYGWHPVHVWDDWRIQWQTASCRGSWLPLYVSVWWCAYYPKAASTKSFRTQANNPYW